MIVTKIIWISANGSRLNTIALLPNSMYGELDVHGCTNDIIYANQHGGRAVKLFNKNMQTSYVGNVAWAHLVAAQALSRGPQVGGQAYFSMDDSPILPYHEFREPFLKRHGFKYTSWAVPVYLAMVISMFIQMFLSVIRIFKIDANWPMGGTGFYYLSKEYTFTSALAEEKLGYKPLYTPEEAFNMSCKFYDDLEFQTRLLKINTIK